MVPIPALPLAQIISSHMYHKYSYLNYIYMYVEMNNWIYHSMFSLERLCK